jgi:two-component system, OmpR family, sensor histidine kinase MprB
MSDGRHLSLRTRVASIVAVAVAVPLILVSLGLQLAIGRALIAAVDRDLVAITEELERDGRGVVVMRGMRRERFGGPSGIVQLVRTIERTSGRSPMLDARLNPDGILLPVDDRVRAVARGEASAFLRTVEVEGQALRVLTVPLGPGLAAQVARPLNEALESITSLRRRTISVTLAAVLLSSLAAWAIAGRTIRPVVELIDRLEGVRGTGDLTRRVDVRGDDEVARVAIAFNGMLARLEAASRAQQQLVADASHELRTPLTSLRTNIEVLLLGVGEEYAGAVVRDEVERSRLFDDVIGQLDEITSMVDGLVDLARADAVTEAMERVDVAGLTADVVLAARRRHPQRAADLVIMSHGGAGGGVRTSPPVVLGDRARLGLALASMLDNAVKYAPEAAVEVDVRTYTEREEVVVRVRDHGPGVPEDHVGRLLEPFYRAPEARGAPGAGLGLALVARVAAAHRGRVGVSDIPGGFEVELVLPLAPPGGPAVAGQPPFVTE